MGWLEGLLSGYADERRQIEHENFVKAEQQAVREGEVYKQLIQSPDPEVRAMAATGILQLGGPRKRKGGLAGWMGEMETSPIYPQLAQYLNNSRINFEHVEIPRQHPAPAPSGALPQPPGSAALPETSPTQGGPPPPTPQLFTDVETPGTTNLAPPPPPRFSAVVEERDLFGPPRFTPPTHEARAVTERPSAFPLGNPKGADLMGEVQAWQALYRQADPTSDYQQAGIEAALQGRGRSTTPFQTVRGEYVDEAGRTITAYATFNKATGRYRLSDGREVANFRPVNTLRLGQWFERAAIRAGYRDGNDVPPEDFDRVQQMANALEFDARQSGAEGTMAGRAAGPLAPKDARDLGVPAGTRGDQLTGQVVPTEVQRERRRAIEGIRAQIEGVRTLAATALPKASELQGLAPNLASAVRQRTKMRTEYAQLQAAVDNIINVLARSVGEQRGSQTEADAERAYNTILQFRGNVSDPFGGDTAESGAARIDETLRYLDSVLAQLPGTPVPTGASVGTPPPARTGVTPPATTATPRANATKDANGNWVITLP